MVCQYSTATAHLVSTRSECCRQQKQCLKQSAARTWKRRHCSKETRWTAAGPRPFNSSDGDGPHEQQLAGCQRDADCRTCIHSKEMIRGRFIYASVRALTEPLLVPKMHHLRKVYAIHTVYLTVSAHTAVTDAKGATACTERNQFPCHKTKRIDRCKRSHQPA